MSAALHFPEVVSNSMRKDLVRCQKRAAYKYESGWTAVTAKKIDLHAGGAFAEGIEVARRAFFEQHLSPEAALVEGVRALYKFYGDFQCPRGSNKSADRMAGALAFYFDQMNYPFVGDSYSPVCLNTRDGVMLGIELNFQHEIDVLHPVTGNKLIYSGRFDQLCRDTLGRIWVEDEKTTSMLGNKWAFQWDMDSQMTGYIWGANKMLAASAALGGEQFGLGGGEVVGALIRGVSILKADYGTVEVQTLRAQWEIDRWYAQMCADFQAWADAFKRGDHRNMAMDHTCALYNNPCEYTRLCKSRNPERMIEGNYVVEFYDPVSRTVGAAGV